MNRDNTPSDGALNGNRAAHRKQINGAVGQGIEYMKKRGRGLNMKQ
jgi:hypothetical protein